MRNPEDEMQIRTIIELPYQLDDEDIIEIENTMEWYKSPVSIWHDDKGKLCAEIHIVYYPGEEAEALEYQDEIIEYLLDEIEVNYSTPKE